MSEFSVDLAGETIPQAQTRVLFREVMLAYSIGAYRSALVTLWTVVVCDLIHKLQSLRDVDADPIATQILTEIEDLQRKRPESPEWEKELLDLTRERTFLLSAAEHTLLSEIQRLRHLCAHPVFDSAEIIYSPNRETVRAAMRNALESLLLKPAIYTRHLTKSLLEDLAEKRDVLVDSASLERYLGAKYFQRLVPALEDRIFRTLWKLTFRLSNDDTDANRSINYRTLCILYLRRPFDYQALVRSEPNYYGEIGRGSPLLYLAEFLARFPAVYFVLGDDVKEILRQTAEDNVQFLVYSSFLYPTTSEYIEAVTAKLRDSRDELDDSTWARFLARARENDLTKLALRAGIASYVSSRNFDAADRRFARMIAPYLEEYDRELLEELLTGIESNSQTYDRKKAAQDHRIVNEACERVIGFGFMPEAYRHFWGSIIY